MPDIEAALVALLDVELAAPVSTRVPQARPAVVVRRSGGSYDPYTIVDRPRVAVRVYGVGDVDAYDLADQVRLTIPTLTGSSAAGTVIVSHRERGMAPVVREDDGDPHWLLTYEFVARKA